MNSKDISQLIEWLGQAKDFVLTQAPDVLQQYMAWNIFVDKIGIVVGVLIILIGISMFICSLGSSHYDAAGLGMFGCFVILIGGTVLIFGSLDLYKARHYPKLYLTDYLMSQVNK